MTQFFPRFGYPIKPMIVLSQKLRKLPYVDQNLPERLLMDAWNANVGYPSIVLRPIDESPILVRGHTCSERKQDACGEHFSGGSPRSCYAYPSGSERFDNVEQSNTLYSSPQMRLDWPFSKTPFRTKVRVPSSGTISTLSTLLLSSYSFVFILSRPSLAALRLRTLTFLGAWAKDALEIL